MARIEEDEGTAIIMILERRECYLNHLWFPIERRFCTNELERLLQEIFSALSLKRRKANEKI